MAEAPSVDPEVEPMLGDAQEVFARLRVAQVDLRQSRQIPPGAVAEGLWALLVGRTDGQALDDWLVAETEVRQKASSKADS